MFKQIFIVASAISTLASYAAEAPAYSYKLLKDARIDITLPTASVDDKKIVLDQAYMVLNEIFYRKADSGRMTYFNTVEVNIQYD